MSFDSSLSVVDPVISHLLQKETGRQQDHIELIASENFVSRAVLEAQGSPLTNKYAEGYPGKRYYGGCEYVDEVESLAIQRACQLFGATYANVQPHSGSQANQAVYFALCQPGDTVLGMSLSAGGHLTHGSPVNMSGKWFKIESYGVDAETHLIDYEALHQKARETKPKLIIAGYSAYCQPLDYRRFRAIADDVGAFLMVDMAHFAGLVAAGFLESPVGYADVVTTTTHKTLRGPRGGMILTKREDLAPKFNSAIFPGIQGGPLMHVIAAKAVAFQEALKPSYKTYISQLIKNIQVLGQNLVDQGYALVSGGTVNHMVLVDLRPHGLTGNVAQDALGRAGIVVNKNAVPFDPAKPTVTSGIRLGSPAMTTRGFQENEFKQTGIWMGQVLEALKRGESARVEAQVLEAVTSLCRGFPLYGG